MTPDTILLNARIRTMDIARPEAAALAIGGGRVLALGTDAEMRALAGPGTVRIDAGGRLCLPGFIDAHCHLAEGGLGLISSADLYRARDLAQLRAALAEHARRWTGPVVLGAGWQPGLFDAQSLTRAAIDAVVPDRPAILYDSSFHNACANSAALALAGLDETSADPPNGHLVRGADGRLTGMLHEDAVAFVEAFLPERTAAERREGALAGMAHANRHGITGIIDPKVTDELAETWGGLAREGAMTLAAGGAAWVRPGEDPAATRDRLVALRAESHGHWHLHSAKFFLDGVFENRTAALLAPYADAGGGNAPVMFAAAELARHAAMLGEARFQMHFHCIGDAALRAAFDCVAAGLAATGPWPALPQIAHCQLVDPADLPRFAALGAMANLQPLWARYDPVIPDIALDMIGAARLAQTYPFRQILNAGAAFCLSSDFPVTTLNPFEIIETAVTRQPRREDGEKPPFLPQEALTVAECVAGYTLHAARALWRDGAGRLRPGGAADLVLLDTDIFACPPHEIGATRALLTLFGGRSVYRAPDFDG